MEVPCMGEECFPQRQGLLNENLSAGCEIPPQGEGGPRGTQQYSPPPLLLVVHHN